MSPRTLDEFMTYLTSSSQPHSITFGEFRDFLLLLPRKVSTAEIYRYYQVRKYMGDDGRGTGRVTMEGEHPPLYASPSLTLKSLTSP
jgi:solute carrier family 25 phosphate transporter 23/24/25/41